MVYSFIELGHNRYETYGGTHRESPRHTATLSRLLRVRVSREWHALGLASGSAIASTPPLRHPIAPGPSAVRSPPHALESRLAHLAAAEDAVSRNYSFPEEPARFTSEVLPHGPHIVRLIISMQALP